MRRVINFSVKLTERWEPVSQFFLCTPSAMEQLLSRVVGVDYCFETMSVKGMLEAMDGRVPSELKERMSTMTVGEAAGLIKALRSWLGRFAKFLEQTVPPQTR